ncbi:MAG: hypothetical protein ACYC28_05650 [Longimicrobiales bacterium]
MHGVDHELPQFVDPNAKQPGCTLFPTELRIFRPGLRQRPRREQCAGSFQDPLLRLLVESCALAVVAKRRGGGLERVWPECGFLGEGFSDGFDRGRIPVALQISEKGDD